MKPKLIRKYEIGETIPAHKQHYWEFADIWGVAMYYQPCRVRSEDSYEYWEIEPIEKPEKPIELVEGRAYVLISNTILVRLPGSFNKAIRVAKQLDGELIMFDLDGLARAPAHNYKIIEPWGPLTEGESE